MNLTYRFFRAVARLVVWLCAPLELRNKERLPAEGPALLIGNHRSLLDGFLLIALCPRPVTFIAAAYLFRIPFVGWIVRQVAAPTGSVQGLPCIAIGCAGDPHLDPGCGECPPTGNLLATSSPCALDHRETPLPACGTEALS